MRRRCQLQLYRNQIVLRAAGRTPPPRRARALHSVLVRYQFLSMLDRFVSRQVRLSVQLNSNSYVICCCGSWVRLKRSMHVNWRRIGHIGSGRASAFTARYAGGATGLVILVFEVAVNYAPTS